MNGLRLKSQLGESCNMASHQGLDLLSGQELRRWMTSPLHLSWTAFLKRLSGVTLKNLPCSTNAKKTKPKNILRRATSNDP